jgi:pseudaminic acid cytidylyltransferase
MVMNNNLCIIPARGGSKRIPKKNIKMFFGKPIISYPIKAATQSKLFKEIMVSTDNRKIAEISKKYGANIPFFRSELNSNDHSILNDVVNEVIVEYKNRGLTFDNVCCILPTACLIKSDDIKKGFEILQKNENYSVRPVLRFKSPIQRSFKMNNKGELNMIEPKNYKIRSQDLEMTYYDSGQFYWFRPTIGLNSNHKLGFEISHLNAQDIDDDEDWKLAEVKFKYNNINQ